MDTDGVKTLVIHACTIGKYSDSPETGDRRAVAAFCGILTDRTEECFWGYGLITNTEALFARCISDTLNDLFPEDDAPSLHVIVRTDGFRKQLEENVPKWRANNGLTSQGKVPDQYDAWGYVYDLIMISKSVTIEAAPDGPFKPLLAKAKQGAADIAKFAQSKLAKVPTTTFESDNGPLSELH